MKTRLLFLYVPILALAMGYLALNQDNPSETSRPGEIESTVVAVPTTPTNTPSPGLAIKPGLGVDASKVAGCELVTHYLPVGDGTVVEAYACESTNGDEKHAYESYPNDALESLAYADAKAAEVLGMRLRESDETKAMSLMLRASALAGGDTAPILLYFNAYPHATAIDDVPVRKTIHMKFVLSAVADLLSTDTAYTAPWEDTIRRYSSDPDTEIAMLHKRALEIIDEMRQIQLDVSGTSNIGGQDDA